MEHNQKTKYGAFSILNGLTTENVGLCFNRIARDNFYNFNSINPDVLSFDDHVGHNNREIMLDAFIREQINFFTYSIKMKNPEKARADWIIKDILQNERKVKEYWEIQRCY